MTIGDLPKPLEHLVLPQHLDGSRGSNRGVGRCQLQAANDLQAIEAWLGEFRDSPQTLRHYRKEAERLLLWALLERGQALSSLNREDLQQYQAFLADPQPRWRWCGARAERFSPAWRPFLGPLSASSRRTALLVLNSLFSYLVEAGYLQGNPMTLMRRRNKGGDRSGSPGIERYLEHSQWQALLETVEALPQDSPRALEHKVRSRYLLALLYLLGPRISEVASHTMASFVQIRGRWWWRVLGKGRALALVPVNQDMLQALREYRMFYGLPPLPEPGERTPLVLSLKGSRSIGANMIHRTIKALCAMAAERLAQDDPHRAEALRRASAHWLRHTSITHQAYAGIALHHLRRNARHAKLDTTGLYLHGDEARWHAEMEKHRLNHTQQEDDDESSI